eukprot:2115104-Amphidinium_carterae.1
MKKFWSWHQHEACKDHHHHHHHPQHQRHPATATGATSATTFQSPVVTPRHSAGVSLGQQSHRVA